MAPAVSALLLMMFVSPIELAFLRLVSTDQAPADVDVVATIHRRDRCSDFAAFYEERLTLRLEYTNRRESPVTLYFRGFRTLEVAGQLSSLLEGRPDHALTPDHFQAPGFRGTRYDLGPAGPGGVATRVVQETIGVALDSTSSAFVKPGRHFIRVIEHIDVPLNATQSEFGSIRVTSNPIEITLPVRPELRACSSDPITVGPVGAQGRQ